MTNEEALKIVGGGFIILVGISTWMYPISPRFGATIIVMGILFYLIS